MKKFISLLSIMSIILLTGCTIKDAYLLHADVESPFVQQPLHLSNGNQDESVKLNVHFSGLTKHTSEGIISKYNDNRYTDSLYNGKNFKWKSPSLNAGLDVDIKISRTFSFFGGLSYAGDDKSDGVGGNFGIGFTGGDSTSHFRLDLGANFQSTYYSAFYYADAEFLPWALDFNFIALEENKKTNVNPFASLTFNTSRNDWFANPFLQVSYLQQNLFKVKVGGGLALNDVYLESDISILNIKPGLSFALGNNYFLSAGASMQFLLGVKDSNKDLFITPFVQMNFGL